MRAQEFITEAETTPVEQFIADVYAEYPQTFQNNHVMAFGEEEFAMFELKPSTSRRGAVELYWFQAYPLRSGVGTRAIQILQNKAREYGVGLTLMPWDKGQVSQAALTKFYKKQGFQPAVKGGRSMIWDPTKQVNEISDEQLQRYLDRAGRQVDARQERMTRARDRLNKGYEIYHADAPNKIVHRFDADTPALAKRYYDQYIANYDSDVDYDLRLRRATGIMEGEYTDEYTFDIPKRPMNAQELIKRGAIFVVDPHGDNGWEPNAEGFSLVTLHNYYFGDPWCKEVKQHLKPEAYPGAIHGLKDPEELKKMSDQKYKQILWSIKKLGIPEEVAFLDTVK